jgi:hypothetical protein
MCSRVEAHTHIYINSTINANKNNNNGSTSCISMLWNFLISNKNGFSAKIYLYTLYKFIFLNSR